MHPNKRAKLGDFNRAEMMDWNEEMQAYCSYSNGEVYGIVSSYYTECTFTLAAVLLFLT